MFLNKKSYVSNAVLTVEVSNWVYVYMLSHWCVGLWHCSFLLKNGIV